MTKDLRYLFTSENGFNYYDCRNREEEGNFYKTKQLHKSPLLKVTKQDEEYYTCENGSYYDGNKIF